jgi:hypothetical protein
VTDADWDVLIERLAHGKCTPFLGAGVNEGFLPLGADLAARWAQRYGYPLPDKTDLAKVAQYVAISRRDGLYPKDVLVSELSPATSRLLPILSQGALGALSAIADLPIHVYITTNYDDLLAQCLRLSRKEPIVELCRWNTVLRRKAGSVFDTRRPPQLSAERPLVYHLHGQLEARESLVLTEDDYLDFLINISREPRTIPARIQQALTDSSLLFIGYGLRDINFRVIYRGLIQQLEGSLRTLSVAVQLSPDDESSRSYLEKYFAGMNVQVYWGTAAEFISELRSRWRVLCHGMGT